jgi:hypothetical protein
MIRQYNSNIVVGILGVGCVGRPIIKVMWWGLDVWDMVTCSILGVCGLWYWLE